MGENYVRSTVMLEPWMMSSLKALHPQEGASFIIRLLIKKYVREVESRTDKPTVDIDFDVGHN